MTSTDVIEAILADLGQSDDLGRKLLLTLALFALAVAARWMLGRLVDREVEDAASRYRLHKLTSYAVTIVLLIGLASIWLQQLAGNLTTYLGLLSAGIAIALREPLSNVAGWLYIASRRPFDLGDRVEIDGIIGDVVDKRIFAFSLMEVGNWVDADQSTGRLVHVPNLHVFVNEVSNYTQGFEFIWNEIPVVVTFESDWRRAKHLLEDIGERHAAEVAPEAQSQMNRASSRFLIAGGAVTPKVYTRVIDIGVQLTLRYLTRARERRVVEERVWEDVLDAFAQQPHVDFAYPTQRLYYVSANASSQDQPPVAGSRGEPPGAGSRG